jgi:hypothetical protein
MTPTQFGKFLADDTEKWAKVVKVRGRQAGLNRRIAANFRRGATS